MATRIRLNLEHEVHLTTEDATTLLRELAETLGFKVVHADLAQNDQAQEWLTRAQFDQTVTEYINANYAHRAWRAMCSRRGQNLLQVKCNDCLTALQPDDGQDDKHNFIWTSSCGGESASRCSISIASFIQAYDEGKLVSSRLDTEGKKITPAIKALVERLRRTSIV